MLPHHAVAASAAASAAAEARRTAVVADIRVHDLVNNPSVGEAWHVVDVCV